MHIVVIGASGHVGSYLVPRLVRLGHRVTAVSRGKRQPYHRDGAWEQVWSVTLDRTVLDEAGTFGSEIAALAPDVVIDLICFTRASAEQLVKALQGSCEHLLVCGTIWIHGCSREVPTREEDARDPFGDYGVNKLAMEEYLLRQSSIGGVPATVIHPGHIVGPGWIPLNPQGHFNPRVFTQIAAGEELVLPNWGLETVHHVHADDVAGLFEAALVQRAASFHQAFHAVSPAALTLRGYAEAMYSWFGQPANLRYAPFEAFRAEVTADEAEATYDHIAHSPNCSMVKAERLLGFRPCYSSLEAVREAVTWLIAHGQVSLPNPSAQGK
ncbi:MAG: NAD-dependent epimerase/dehydratase family protein [Chloroflexi bacterium]|nr:NAD-dependent epimerase/dehydratase family protein [Chloroflexota bacterium]